MGDRTMFCPYNGLSRYLDRTMFCPYRIVFYNNNNSVNMIGHYDIFIQNNVFIVIGDIIPNFFDNFSVLIKDHFMVFNLSQ